MPSPRRDQPGGRRSHRKSRNGCSGCKRRHIKCDETRPQCRNCIMSELSCSFLNSDTGCDSSTSKAIGEIFTPRNDTELSVVLPRAPPKIAPSSVPIFTASHIAFLHHAESHMSEFMTLQGNVRPIIDIVVEHALTAPHLLDQLLALSALHLSTRDTTLTSSLNRQATELQTRALGCFADAKEHISDTTYMPTFIFATLLGIHVLYETLQKDHRSLAGFVDDFVDYSRLHRGVRAVTERYWPKILQSNLKPLLHIPTLAQQVDSQPPGIETEQLKKFLAASPTVSASNNGCLSALSGIQWVLDIAKQEPSRFDVGVHAVMAWPLYVSNEYFEALRQHQPEALVVLAFYAAILHRYRQFWAFGTSGSSIVHMVANSIGSFWQDALSWPLQVLIES